MKSNDLWEVAACGMLPIYQTIAPNIQETDKSTHLASGIVMFTPDQTLSG
jgi:hypothetical protein